jgi:hypothetical protein
MRQVIRVDVRLEGLEIGIDRAGLELVRPVCDVNAGVAEQHPARAGNRPHSQVEIELLGQAIILLVQLPQQCCSDDARPDQADRDGLVRQVKAGMCSTQCPRRVGGVHDGRDVAL